jgi:hypothetical protein
MKKLALLALASAACIALASPAVAHDGYHHHHHHVLALGVAPAVIQGTAAATGFYTGFGRQDFFATPGNAYKGFGTTAAGYGAGVLACGPIALIINSVVVGQVHHRELTVNEAWQTLANCALPFIGGMIVNEIAKDDPASNKIVPTAY